MNAQKFASMCRFQGGKPGLYFRDHTRGRIKVMTVTTRCEWVATVVPGELLGVDAECVLLSIDGNEEYRVSYGEAAALVGALQQDGWDAVGDVYDAIWETSQALGLDLRGLDLDLRGLDLRGL